MRLAAIGFMLCGAILSLAMENRRGLGQTASRVNDNLTSDNRVAQAPSAAGPSPAAPMVRPDQPWLGVSRWGQNLREVILCGVLKDGPAGKAGLRADDTILSIGGKPVRTMEEFHALIDSHRPGEQVAVVIERDGRQASVTVTLEAIPPDGGTGRILAAAEAGESWAMMEMGVRYSHGRGNLSYCKKDPEEAVRWFRRSMEAGYTLGPLFLADMYRKGEGVEQDYAEAKRLYEKALLVQGEGLHKGVYIAATNRLAAMYLAGQGTPEDPQTAFQLYHDAALHGSSSAMVKVGKMCEAGQGVQKDMSKAVGWYRHAAGLGYTPAQKELDRLAPRK